MVYTSPVRRIQDGGQTFRKADEVEWRVHNRFGGMRDLAIFRGDTCRNEREEGLHPYATASGHHVAKWIK